MTRTGGEREQTPDQVSDRLLWQRCRMMDAPDDEASRFLDLAGFADGLLDPEERDRVAAMVEADPAAAADVGAARALRGADQTPAGIEHIVACISAILPDAAPAHGRVFAFAPRQGRRRRIVYDFAQWGSLAAALAVASWLGFSMGTDASLALSEPRQPSDASFLPELFDPATSFLRDLGEGLRT